MRADELAGFFIEDAAKVIDEVLTAIAKTSSF